MWAGIQHQNDISPAVTHILILRTTDDDCSLTVVPLLIRTFHYTLLFLIFEVLIAGDLHVFQAEGQLAAVTNKLVYLHNFRKVLPTIKISHCH